MDRLTKNQKIGLAVAAGVLIIGGLIYYAKSQDSYIPLVNNPVSFEPKEGEISVTGQFACLPYQPESPSINQECVLGIKGNDDLMYALDTTRVVHRVRDLSEGGEVTAVGSFFPVNRESEEAGVFIYDGVLSVRVLRTQ